MTAVLIPIWDEIDRRLSAVPNSVTYERMPSGDPDAFPSLAGFDNGDAPDPSAEVFSDRLSMQLSVEGYVKGHGGAETHAEMVQLHADAVAALCGDAGSNLGGLVENIQISGTRRVTVLELANERRLSFAQDFEVTYATRRGDPNHFA